MSNSTVQCPALVVTAPSSGSGKTTVVAALARHFHLQGKKVRVFKTGPDFIDPRFLEFASQQPVYQLDFWMCGEKHCKALIAEAAKEADLILIEGVMGMFDGHCSSADIAARLGIPVLAVIDAGAMAQTFGALAYGLANYRDDIEMFGVVANRVGSVHHAQMLQESLPENLAFCGWLPKESGITLPERHLGLVQADELEDLDQRLDRAAELIGEFGKVTLPPPMAFDDVSADKVTSHLAGKTIAIARDRAFSFIYRANIDLLQAMGADVQFFSPISGDCLPDCDALYLPGGYPELSTGALAENQTLIAQIKQHVEQGKPCLAECGGMLYLNRSLTMLDGTTAILSDVLDADSAMQPKLAALGMVEAAFSYNNDTCNNSHTLRGHTFHYSTTQSNEQVLTQPVSQRGRKTDPVWFKNNLIASYIHWYFPSNPKLVADIFSGKVSEQ
ncbi:cobyrinate a,c-diamide synthase [Photobacterium lipolyticum]|uniref:Cobyrinate a,c-diamide synthase n=1 Tax=Photobacterium lipolyticum TaxID=266810 RepID=A0A2T3N0W8_9GAMM|nr:cobyrinate a,c-diamide synthase [Photobacterium lipolyticum]PSW05977.1 cobyrinate a,c-diamide synthase [Photobacterium lipolyticum]